MKKNCFWCFCGIFWFPCAAWEPILDAVHPVQIAARLPSITWDGMRRISPCIPMRRMGTRSFKSTPELHLVLLLVLLVPMRRMGTHP